MTRLGQPYGECSDTDARNMSQNMNEDLYTVQYSTQVSYMIIRTYISDK